MSFGEEDFKSWDCIESDKIVYCAQTIKLDFETRDRVGLVDWFSKNNSGDIYMELNLAFLGERNVYFRCVADVAPPSIGDSENAELKFNVADSDNLVLVDVAKLVDLPQGMILKGWPSRIRLKRLNNLEGFRGYASNLFIEALIARSGTLGLDRECGQSSGLIRGQQRQLPSEMV